MRKGFKPPDNLIDSIIEKRLLPPIKREDEQALKNSIDKMRSRYGGEAVARVLGQLVGQYDWLYQFAAANSPIEMKENILAASFEIIAEKLEAAGLQLERHFRVCDQGIAMTYKAIEAIRELGFPDPERFGGNDSIDGLGISRVGGFAHPLSELRHSPEINEDVLNPWGFASVLISGALGWLETLDNGEKARAALTSAIATVAPTMDANRALRQARYDDRVLMKLCALFVSSLDQAVDRSLNK